MNDNKVDMCRKYVSIIRPNRRRGGKDHLILETLGKGHMFLRSRRHPVDRRVPSTCNIKGDLVKMRNHRLQHHGLDWSI